MPPTPEPGGDARVRALFEAALDVDSARRESYVRASAGDDRELERRVLRLIAAHERVDGRTQTATRTAGLATPERVGRYRILSRIGEGGMGVVYLAEQTEPIRRQVALKVVKAGMSTEEVIARFHAERQSLALMDHPGIARIFDSGATEQGLPYFVMEHVPGLPLVAHCDQRNLSLEERLGLFVQVCRAVQHAHTKGIIHRDIKPSNLLVAEVDGHPVPKVIDFGIARAIDRGSADEMAFTRTGGVVGTPAYMSPEQVEGGSAEIDTRSDVYALGVVLYELLAGALPFETASFHELQRALREQDPPRPSTRVGGLGAAGTTVAARRGASQARLVTRLRGDLDWVVMKALERDRERRYQTAESFARDVERYLANEPVTATPPSRTYLVRKFVARHRIAVSAASVVVLALIAGTVGTTIGLLRAEEQRKLAVRQGELADDQRRLAVERGEAEVEQRRLADLRTVEANVASARAIAARDFLTNILANANPLKSLRKEVKVADLLLDASKRLDAGEFAADPDIEYELRYTLGVTFHALDHAADAVRELERALVLAPDVKRLGPLDVLQIRLELGETLSSHGATERAAAIAQAAIAELDAARVGEHEVRSRALQLLATARYSVGATPEAITLQRSALEMRERLDPADVETLANMRNALAFFLIRGGAYAEALVEIDRALAVLREGSPRARIQAAYGLRLRANALDSLDRDREAESDLVAALKIREELFDENSPALADLLHDLGQVELDRNKVDAAQTHALRALEIRRARLGDHRDTATSLALVAAVARQLEDVAAAIRYNEEALAMRRRLFDANSPAIGDSLRRLGVARRDAGNLDVSETLLREAVANWSGILGDAHPDVATARLELARTLRLQRNFDEATAQCILARDLVSKKFGPTSSRTREVRDLLIGVRMDAEDWTGAQAIVEDALAVERAAQPGGGLLQTYLAAQLGGTLIAQGRTQEAEELLLAGWKAMGERKDLFPENKLVVLDSLVRLYVTLGDEEAAERYRVLAAGLRGPSDSR